MLIGVLNAMPAWAMALSVCLIAVTATTIAQLVLHGFWRSESRSKLNEVAGFLIAVVGVIYAVLLASIAILVLERHSTAEHAVHTEAGELSDLFGTASGLQPAIVLQVRNLITEYGHTVTEIEWPQMAHGVPPESGWQDKGWEQIEALDELLLSAEPTSETQKVALAKAVNQVDDLSDARRERLFHTGSGLGPLVWWVVIAGAAVTVGLALFFGLPTWRGHLLLADMLSLSIALVFVLIIAMDRPFVGESGVTARSFDRVMAQIEGFGRR